MKYLQQDWQARTAIIVLVSVVISIAMIALELTPWAEQINLQGYEHGGGKEGKKSMDSALIYILPFVKVLVLTGVPLLITLIVLKVTNTIKRWLRRK
ncbi:hypothetical protein [Ferrimonas lipolytica]|uniref:Uncharacterized protein n=1 Tax=Ferrimonas lipolytica TaxID=2724191 RepID=A0A6H1UFQ3_9GAMM|nr:hypothetical protein [Ferrimonas lipolytica]QIZ77935.1 hypothetical protein HER31_14145 [Ferrimonas lipolytica]